MSRLIQAIALFYLVAPTAGPAHAQDEPPIHIVERFTLSVDRIAGASAPSDSRLALALVYFDAGAWSPDAAFDATRGAAKLLRQCGVATTQVEVVRVAAPRKYQFLDTPVSRELARSLGVAKPTVYFVTDTRQEPAFDAEAIGRANSRTRPELADTVWVTRATRDPTIALAHELVHVLADDGTHSDLPGNLMREKTAPENTHLSSEQCARLRAVGTRNELLRTNQ